MLARADAHLYQHDSAIRHGSKGRGRCYRTHLRVDAPDQRRFANNCDDRGKQSAATGQAIWTIWQGCTGNLGKGMRTSTNREPTGGDVWEPERLVAQLQASYRMRPDTALSKTVA